MLTLFMELSGRHLDRQVASTAQVFYTLGTVFSAVKYYICTVAHPLCFSSGFFIVSVGAPSCEVGSLATLYDGSVMLICTYVALFFIIVVRYVCTGNKVTQVTSLLCLSPECMSLTFRMTLQTALPNEVWLS